MNQCQIWLQTNTCKVHDKTSETCNYKYPLFFLTFLDFKSWAFFPNSIRLQIMGYFPKSIRLQKWDIFFP